MDEQRVEINDGKYFGNKIEYPFKFGGFTIYETYGICDTCGNKVEGGGIIVLSRHFVECGGKGFYEGLMKLAASKKDEGIPISIEDINSLQEQTLPK